MAVNNSDYMEGGVKMMTDVIVILILLALIVPAVCYIVRAKKSGQACIGCPNGGKCHSNCGCACKSMDVCEGARDGNQHR